MYDTFFWFGHKIYSNIMTVHDTFTEDTNHNISCKIFKNN